MFRKCFRHGNVHVQKNEKLHVYRGCVLHYRIPKQMIFMLLFFFGEEPESDTHGDNYQMDVRRLEQAFNISPTTENDLSMAQLSAFP